MIRASALVLFLKISGALLWILFSIYIARVLTQEEFGLFFYLINFMLLVTPVACVGFNNVILRFGSLYWKKDEKISFFSLLNQARFFVLIASSLIIIVLFIAWWLKIDNSVVSSANNLLVSGSMVALFSIMNVHRDALRATDQIFKGMLNTTITRSLIPMIGCGIVVVFFELNVDRALLLYILGMLVSIVLEIYWLSKLKGGSIGVFYSNKKEHVKVGVQLWLADVANTIIIRVDAFVVGIILDLKSVALYLAAQRISVLTTFIIDAVRTAIGAEISKSFDGNSDNEQYRSVVSKASALFALAGLFGMSGVIIVGYPLLTLFGEAYKESYLIVIILTVGQSALIIFGPSALIMSMTNMERQRAIVTLFSAVLVILSTWFGGITYGITGIALAVAITMWINSSILALLIWKNQKVISGIFNRKSWNYFDLNYLYIASVSIIQRFKRQH